MHINESCMCFPPLMRVWNSIHEAISDTESAGCLGQTIAAALWLFAEYNHLCILMLNVSFLLQRGGYWFGYSRKLAVVLVYGVFGPIHVERHAVFPDDRISLGYTVATL